MKLFHLHFVIYAAIMAPLTLTETNQTLKDPIIGTWELERLHYNFSDGSLIEEVFTKCHDKVRHVYMKDGTLNYIFPDIDNSTGECSYNNKEFWTGTWKRIGENTYQTEHKQHYTTTKSSFTDSMVVYKFSKDGTTLKTLKTYADSGILFDSEKAAISELASFRRMD